MLVAALVYHNADIQCAEGLYSLKGKYCVTAEQCKKYDNNYYVFEHVRICFRTYTYPYMQCVDYVCECTDLY